MFAKRLLLLFLAAVFLLSLGNGTLPLTDRDEPRFAEASREMLERADWVVPYFNNKFRFDKPPLIYWLQAASYSVLGETDTAARLPSVLCAALAAVALAAWGARLQNPTTGLRAGLIFLLNLQVFAHGRAAVADMAMVLFVLLAAWTGWEWIQSRRVAWALAFWTALGLGFLAKGPIALVPIAMAGTLAAGLPRESRPHWGLWPAGLLLTTTLIALWGIPALLKTNGEFAAVGLGKHVVSRTIAPMEGHGSKTWATYLLTLPLYLVTLFPGFAPWSFWLPAALRNHWREKTPIARYLLVGSALVFGIFTLSRTKLPHYTLPAFPFLALLLALWWPSQLSQKTFTRSACAAAFLGIFLPILGFPFANRLFLSSQLRHHLSPHVSESTAFGSVEYHEPSLVWYLRSKTRHFHEPLKEREAVRWMEKDGPRLCILPTPVARKLFPALAPDWKQVTVEGLHVVKGKRVELTALIKPSKPDSHRNTPLETSVQAPH
ncbi:MAG: Undecaprenyl phosphate-alpha-4-amino-4-deoxy-L-arabinose arabinosyl transferase [Verrucomicrobiota bacterium]|jgi:4-amino-4-deoxy-L-arabinose transferase-like glycosyltransferase